MKLGWKVCGITSPADAAAAVAAGADALGFVFYPPSPRAVSLAGAAAIAADLPARIRRVGVFVDASAAEMAAAVEEVGLDLLQLSGDEPPELCNELPRPVWKALRLPPGTPVAEAESSASAYRNCTWLLDAGGGGRYGGTGETVDWDLAAHLAERHRLVLAGGLRVDNVAEAVAKVCPWGIDVASGVESAPGRKDQRRLREFAAALEGYR